MKIKNNAPMAVLYSPAGGRACRIRIETGSYPEVLP